MYNTLKKRPLDFDFFQIFCDTKKNQGHGFYKLNIFRKPRNTVISSSQWNVSMVNNFEFFGEI